MTDPIQPIVADRRAFDGSRAEVEAHIKLLLDRVEQKGQGYQGMLLVLSTPDGGGTAGYLANTVEDLSRLMQGAQQAVVSAYQWAAQQAALSDAPVAGHA
jgi:hypothetical protein